MEECETSKTKSWDGRTDSTSPYFHLRQKGYSHADAVAIIEGRRKRHEAG